MTRTSPTPAADDLIVTKLSPWSVADSVARVLHCLEPRLIYHTRRRQISIEINIPGLRQVE